MINGGLLVFVQWPPDGFSNHLRSVPSFPQLTQQLLDLVFGSRVSVRAVPQGKMH
jgi:hypothetical protein